MRADVFLVEAGHAATRSQAQRLIAAGVEWRLSPLAPWQKVAKNGDDIPSVAEVKLLDDAEAKYISRGGLKLEGALRATGLSVAGLRCLDVGQSTGGFTDCLLQHGAAQVIGVDVGHGQLHERLRADPRVVGVEGLNARAMTAQSLQDACEEALSEQVEVDVEDNDTQPVAPYAWMRNGGEVGEEYDDSDDAKEQDVEAFKAEYKRLPSIYAAQSWDTANLILAALSKADVKDKDAFRAALKAADFQSVRGKFVFNNNNHPIQNIYVREVVKEADGVLTNKIIATAFEDHKDAYADKCSM